MVTDDPKTRFRHRQPHVTRKEQWPAKRQATRSSEIARSAEHMEIGDVPPDLSAEHHVTPDSTGTVPVYPVYVDNAAGQSHRIMTRVEQLETRLQAQDQRMQAALAALTARLDQQEVATGGTRDSLAQIGWRMERVEAKLWPRRALNWVRRERLLVRPPRPRRAAITRPPIRTPLPGVPSARTAITRPPRSTARPVVSFSTTWTAVSRQLGKRVIPVLVALWVTFYLVSRALIEGTSILVRRWGIPAGRRIAYSVWARCQVGLPSVTRIARQAWERVRVHMELRWPAGSRTGRRHQRDTLVAFAAAGLFLSAHLFLSVVAHADAHETLVWAGAVMGSLGALRTLGVF